MAKRNIEINDVLPDCVQEAIEATESMLRSFCEEEMPDRVPCLHNDLDYSGSVHEAIGGAVPIWTADIEAAWFLHGGDLEEAYESAGVGDNPRDNNGTAAIYYYIEQKVCEWYSENAKEIWHDCCTDKS